MKYFFYTPELMQLATFASNDGVGSDVIWFDGGPVASDSTDGPDPRFTFTDHLGTPILQTDALANVVWRAEYEPFGNLFAMRAGGANDQRLRFPGQQVAFTNFAGDEENYNIFRWYRSGWGRYTQADPAWEPERASELNHYAYVAENPIRRADPAGLCASCDDCPSGEWNFNSWPGFGVSAAAGWGKSVTWGTYVCKGNGREVRVRIECSIAGPIVGVGMGFSGPTGLKPMACGCKENNLFGTSGGWTGWLGPVNVDGGKCGTQAGGTTNSMGIAKSWGAGFAGTRCTTKKVD
jgi:RHS repeat-associated protein